MRAVKSKKSKLVKLALANENFLIFSAFAVCPLEPFAERFRGAGAVLCRFHRERSF